MPELRFAVQGVEAVTGTATPAVGVRLSVRCATGEPIVGVLLRCQARLFPARRRHTPSEQERLGEVFGGASAWSTTMRHLLWTETTHVLSPFEGETSALLHLPATYDLGASTSRYFDSLNEGEVAAALLFSGTIYYRAPERDFAVSPLPTTAEATFSIPVSVWRRAVVEPAGGAAAVLVAPATLDRLDRARIRRGLSTLDEAVRELLDGATEGP
jgi:alpha-ketoglutarate-dependent taurine dioxygenase